MPAWDLKETKPQAGLSPRSLGAPEAFQKTDIASFACPMEFRGSSY